MESLMWPDTRRPRPEVAPIHTKSTQVSLISLNSSSTYFVWKAWHQAPQNRRRKRNWLVKCRNTQGFLLLTSLVQEKSLQLEQYLPAPGKAPWLLLATTKTTYPRLSGVWAFEKQLTGLGTSKPSKPGQDKLPRKPRCSSMLSPQWLQTDRLKYQVTRRWGPPP